MLNIITDSSAEISEEEASALGIKIIPLTVIFGGNAYLEGAELTKDEFYTRLLGGEYPHTSLPSAEQFTEEFTKAEGRETLVILISSALSGTVNAAELAKREGGFTNVHVYDSKCTTAMLRIMVETACKNREKTAEEVIAILDELRPRIRIFACLDTLDYLYKGGRIKKSIAIVGGLLGIKPLITFTPEGAVVMHGKAHGQKKALKALAEIYGKHEIDGDYPVYFLQTDADAPALQLMRATGNDGARKFRICCAVGTHIGPNAAGMVFVVKK